MRQDGCTDRWRARARDAIWMGGGRLLWGSKSMASQAALNTSQAAEAEAERPAVRVHVVHLIPTLDIGGAETALSRIVGATDERLRHSVILLRSGGTLRQVVEAAGAQVHELQMSRGPASFLQVPKLLRLVRSLHPDVIQGWMAHANVMAWFARTFGSPSSALAWNLRMTVRDIVGERFETRLLTRLAGALSRSVDVVVSNSSRALTEHVEIGYAPRSTELIPNGFDINRFKPNPQARVLMRARLGLAQGDVAFGLVGRFHPAKGHRDFLAAAAQVARRFPQARFVLIGRMPAGDPLLEGWIAEAGGAGRVVVVGETPDVHAYLAALDVACAPSLYEGFPNAVGEAMSAGVACVATAVSDVPHILGDGGLVVPVSDVAALANAMSEMIEIGEAGRSEYAARGRARVERCYTIESAARQYEDLYLALKRARTRTGARDTATP